MHCLLLAAALPVALASLNQTPRNVLVARQGGDSFIPSTSEGPSCGPEDQCGGGDGSEVVCLDRVRGDVCCAENYGCPGDSFCLTQGFCCPTGDDPATCAAANGITLPAGFKAGQTISSGGPTSSAPASSATSPPAVTSSSYSSVVIGKTSTSVPVPVYSVPSNASSHGPVIAPTGSVVASATTVPFTGGASVTRAGVIGGLISVVGGYAAFLLL